ncbi:MAG TPA: LysR family transcriptional regulator, partial [Marinobacter hydrocarbonoclasticus]|nr:LysR family transcriptional regulator [Marinobacter nauticus]
MLNLVWLKSFVAVLDHNGFQAAARQLDIAQ